MWLASLPVLPLRNKQLFNLNSNQTLVMVLHPIFLFHHSTRTTFYFFYLFDLIINLFLHHVYLAITEYIESNSSQTTSPREFNRLNFCLDIAIAEAVTEFNRGQRENAERSEVERLGFLAHELRNSLTSA